MFFVVSKLFWLVAQPVSILFLLVLAGLVLLVLRRRRSAIAALVLALTLTGLIGYTSLGYVAIGPLENRFAVPATPPDNVGAIIMLGGATDSHVSAFRQTVAFNSAGERLTTTLWLARRYPNAKIVLSGGGGSLSPEAESEAETARRFFVEQGVDETRLILEAHSRNTIENAAFTRDILEQGAGQTVLVTSAFHMPRSVGLFRMQGIDVVPWPTDFRSTGSEMFGLDLADPVENLVTTSTAMREWIGLTVYWATGQIGTWFPAP
ncbi:YdcF family protein [Devosia sp. XK-2]|uniref:YdcF family protein n=1 Tax=Devosia sp. XK-2 TaxID=3126689 RepID=UPI0030CEC247